MIKFFRKIRQNLLTENKFSKYLLYAIGEIILVVIGILIALSINNWNEERKAAENTMFLFKLAHKELQYNIKSTAKIVNIYRGKDSIAYKVINKKVSKEEFRLRPTRYLSLLTYGKTASVSDKAFQNLINNKGETSQKQDSLILKLKMLNGVNKAELEMMDSKLPEYIFGILETYKNDQDWYYEYYNFKTVSNKMLDYFLVEPDYFNEVTYYKTAFLGQHFKNNLEFRQEAIKIYDELSDYLKIPKDTTIVKNVKDYDHYFGTYKSDQSKFIIQIVKRKDKLIRISKHETDSTRSWEFNFYPDSKTDFTIGGNFGLLMYDENKQVSGFIRSMGNQREEYKKIK
jgi:hypothetical protein